MGQARVISFRVHLLERDWRVAIRFVLSDNYAHLTREERQQLLHVLCPLNHADWIGRLWNSGYERVCRNRIWQYRRTISCTFSVDHLTLDWQRWSHPSTDDRIEERRVLPRPEKREVSPIFNWHLVNPMWWIFSKARGSPAPIHTTLSLKAEYSPLLLLTR
jgi:hypothetical protein